MKIVTSPAKLMKTGHKVESPLRSSTPLFIEQATALHEVIKTKTPQYLKKLMEISDKLADENWERFQNWVPHPKTSESAQAIFAFQGEVYRGLDASSLGEPELQYLQKNYRILSGLYGLLRPSDRIMLYRLEMGRKFAIEGHSDLYSFWKEILTERLSKELKKGEIILNLASAEYARALDFKQLTNQVLDVEFLELKSGKPKNIVVYTKHARGLMVRYCAIHQVTKKEQLFGFNLEGYRYEESLSTDQKITFTR